MAFGSGQSAGALPPAGQTSTTPAGGKGVAQQGSVPAQGLKGGLFNKLAIQNQGPYGPNLNQPQVQKPYTPNPMVDNNYSMYPGAQTPAQGKGAVGTLPADVRPYISTLPPQNNMYDPSVMDAYRRPAFLGQPNDPYAGTGGPGAPLGGPNVLYSPPNMGGMLNGTPTGPAPTPVAPTPVAQTPVAQPAVTTTTAQPPTGLAGLQQRRMDHDKERMMRQQEHDQRRAAHEKERMMRQQNREQRRQPLPGQQLPPGAIQ